MKLNQLKLFVMIAEEGQIGLAAVRAGMTQPALTKSVNSLERALGSRLFQRTRNGVQLTQAGALLLARARGIVCSADEAKRELEELATGAIGRLRVGAGPSMAEYLLPQVIGELLPTYPRIELKVTSALNDVLFESLRAGDVDIVVSGIPETAPLDFEQELLMHDQQVVVARADHPLVGRQRVPLRELVEQSWVLPPPGVLARRWLNNQFEMRSLPAPHAAVEADSNVAIISIVANTHLITFQPRSNLATLGAHKGLSEVRGAELRWRRPIGVTWRKGSYLPQVAQRFTASLRATAARLSAPEVR
ncbi:MAG TPA: LysR family transcriptional regulator [Burkholderiales bacterium]|nr:LysR family transcriptional regulator [Burkholderiales bacterium]